MGYIYYFIFWLLIYIKKVKALMIKLLGPKTLLDYQEDCQLTYISLCMQKTMLFKVRNCIVLQRVKLQGSAKDLIELQLKLLKLIALH